MLLQPRKTKYKKVQKGRIQSYDSKFHGFKFGHSGLQALESCYLRANQLEAARQCITRHLQRKGRVWLGVFPDLGITKRPTQVRMGKGTGSIKYWAFRLRSGTILFEVDGVDKKEAFRALSAGASKLPFRVKLLQE